MIINGYYIGGYSINDYLVATILTGNGGYSINDYLVATILMGNGDYFINDY
jgi:hypothetical protein